MPTEIIFKNPPLTVLGAGLGWGVFPPLVESQVEDNIDLTNEESEGYKNFVSSKPEGEAQP